MKEKIKIDVTVAIRLYETGLSQREVGELMGVSAKRISDTMLRAGYKARLPKEVIPQSSENFREIPLSRGVTAKVDSEDFDWLTELGSWSLSKTGYAYNRGLKMHRVIFAYHGLCNKGESLDHINRDKLDNRKANLRIADNRQNAGNVGLLNTNTSGIRGVYWHKTEQKWIAALYINNKKKTIGRFTNKKDAAQAYNEAAKEHFGEFAYLNPIREEDYVKHD